MEIIYKGYHNFVLLNIDLLNPYNKKKLNCLKQKIDSRFTMYYSIKLPLTHDIVAKRKKNIDRANNIIELHPIAATAAKQHHIAPAFGSLFTYSNNKNIANRAPCQPVNNHLQISQKKKQSKTPKPRTARCQGRLYTEYIVAMGVVFLFLSFWLGYS